MTSRGSCTLWLMKKSFAAHPAHGWPRVVRDVSGTGLPALARGESYRDWCAHARTAGYGQSVVRPPTRRARASNCLKRAAFLRQLRLSISGVPEEYSPGSRIELVTRLIAVTMTL